VYEKYKRFYRDRYIIIAIIAALIVGSGVIYIYGKDFNAFLSKYSGE